MQLQQPLIKEYIDLLFSTLKAKTETSPSAVVDMAAYLNYTTFDIIGDLSFGSSFSCLASESLHPWVQVIFDGALAFNRMTTLRRHTSPLLIKAITKLRPSLLKGIMMQNQYARRKVDERMTLGAERHDFIEAMIKSQGDAKKEMEYDEIVSNARVLVIAGSETTATALAGAAYLLAMHRDVQRKLAEEVRGTFKSEEEIEWTSVGGLKYMLAVLDESMRIMPPAPGSFPRVCQEGGDVICGKFVPGGVSYSLKFPRGDVMIDTDTALQTGLEIWNPVINRCSRNFTLPNEFIPERWLDGEHKDKRFANDNSDVFQPFSVGPRNCIGKK